MRKYICANCDSEDIGIDAIAKWNIESQQWELASTYDHGYCEHCDCDEIKWIDIESGEQG